MDKSKKSLMAKKFIFMTSKLLKLVSFIFCLHSFNPYMRSVGPIWPHLYSPYWLTHFMTKCIKIETPHKRLIHMAIQETIVQYVMNLMFSQ